MQDITWREGTEREVSGETEELRTRSNKRPIACNMGSDGGGKMKPTERSSHLFLSWTSMECHAQGKALTKTNSFPKLDHGGLRQPRLALFLPFSVSFDKDKKNCFFFFL